MRALILAAGEGTRLRPLTLDRPKPMLPIGGKPLLEHLVTWLRRHGITDIAINLHHRPAAITDYFGDGQRFGVSITYSYEAQLLGTAGAAKKLQPFFDETFVVVYGDVFTNLDLTRLIGFHNSHRTGSAVPSLRPEHLDRARRSLRPKGPASAMGDTLRSGRSTTEPGGPLGCGQPPTKPEEPAVVIPPVPSGSSGSCDLSGPCLTLALYHVENPSACGLVELDDHGRVIRFVEKPPPDQVFTTLANAGVLVLEPGILGHIPADTFYDFGHDLLPRLLTGEVPIYGFPLRDDEFLIDIGTPASYRRAQECYAIQGDSYDYHPNSTSH